MTATRMLTIDVVEVRGSKKSLKLKNKLTRVLVDETFEDVLLNLEEDIDTRYKTCQIELKTSVHRSMLSIVKWIKKYGKF